MLVPPPDWSREMSAEIRMRLAARCGRTSTEASLSNTTTVM